MSELKTLKEKGIRWIKAIRKKSEEHWEELNKKGYSKEEKGYDPYTFELEGLIFQDWHEATDKDGAIMILKHTLNIKEEDLK